jgi:hypothetical protein
MTLTSTAKAYLDALGLEGGARGSFEFDAAGRE